MRLIRESDARHISTRDQLNWNVIDRCVMCFIRHDLRSYTVATLLAMIDKRAK